MTPRAAAGAAAFLLALAASGPAPAQECGVTQDCALEGGGYRMRAPEGPAKGAVIFLHGYGGSGAAQAADAALTAVLNDRGYALIAPTGASAGGKASWNAARDPAGRDDVAFLDLVADDAAARLGFPRDRTILAGFSAGAMMVWRIACDDPAAFAAYAPVSGTFWRPAPADCGGPVRLLHTHGWSDAVVPLEGRAIRQAGIEQGDLFAALALLRAAAGCADDAPASAGRDGAFLVRAWSCGPGSDLALRLHDGGHTVPPDWAETALDWFEAGADQ